MTDGKEIQKKMSCHLHWQTWSTGGDLKKAAT